MVISIENISQKQGGNGGIGYNDYEDIINKFGGVTNIRSVKPKQAIIRSGDAIDSFQFVYNVVTEDGISHDHTGNKCGGSGGIEQYINFSDDEQITSINGRHGSFGGADVLKYLQIQTSRASYNYGISSPTDTSFTLQGDIIFCSSGE